MIPKYQCKVEDCGKRFPSVGSLATHYRWGHRDQLLFKWGAKATKGSTLDVEDYRDEEWYPATVTKVSLEKKKVKIHFDGWGSDYDEWYSNADPRLAKRDTHSHGAPPEEEDDDTTAAGGDDKSQEEEKSKRAGDQMSAMDDQPDEEDKETEEDGRESSSREGEPGDDGEFKKTGVELRERERVTERDKRFSIYFFVMTFPHL